MIHFDKKKYYRINGLFTTALSHGTSFRIPKTNLTFENYFVKICETNPDSILQQNYLENDAQTHFERMTSFKKRSLYMLPR